MAVPQQKLAPGGPEEKSQIRRQRVPQLILSEGAKRIAIELEGNPAKVKDYTRKWDALISDIVRELTPRLEGLTGVDRELQFIIEITKIMRHGLGITYNPDRTKQFISHSLDSHKFDCDNSSLLVYDVAHSKKIGVNAQIVVTYNHALIKTENFGFETTKGKWTTIEKMWRAFPKGAVLPPDQIKGLGHISLANSYKNNPEKALATNAKALKVIPVFAPIIHDNRAGIYFGMGAKKYRDAIAELDAAIKLDTTESSFYLHRGKVHSASGNYRKAIEDLSYAIKLNPKELESYQARAVTYRFIGELELAEQDSMRYEQLKAK